MEELRRHSIHMGSRRTFFSIDGVRIAYGNVSTDAFQVIFTYRLSSVQKSLEECHLL